jgi:membrane-associated protease RseP (regulator of RpoE activity)
VTDTPVIQPPARGGAGIEPRGEIAGGGWRLGILIAGVVGLGVFAGKSWLMIIGALFVMIFLHELGHFLAAKWSGMKVTEFFIFVGPKIWSFRRGETEYGVKLIPIAAYVRIIGMNNLDDCPPEDEPRTYRQQSFPKRLLTVSAGSLMHFGQAFVLFLIVFAFLGVPAGTDLADRFGGGAPQDWRVNNVVEDSAAASAGLQPGDKVVTIDGDDVEEFGDVGPLVRDRVGDRISIVVQRGDEALTLDATIGARPDDDSGDGFLGVGGEAVGDAPPPVTTGPFDAVGESARFTVSSIGETISHLGEFVTGGLGGFAENVADGSSAEGPAIAGSSENGGRAMTRGDEDRITSMVGIARFGAQASDDGMADFLILLALVNLSIGVLNMLPLLPLDGGHAAIAIYERIRSRNGRRHMADISRLLPLTYAVFLLLVFVSMSAVYLDIVDPVGLG